MKKRILVTLLVAIMTFAGSVAIAASQTGAGGYPYQDENGQINLAGYFTVKGAKLKLAEEQANIVMEGKEATVAFNKPLASDNFQIVFAGVAGSTLNKVEFVLTDSENKNETVKVAYNRMNERQTSIIVNDAQRSFITTGSLYKKNDGNFTVSYSGASNCFGDGVTLVIPVMETVNGESFDGFSSQKVNLTMRLYGKKGSAFCLKSINQQRIGKKYAIDRTAPLVSVVNPIDYVAMGSEVNLPVAFATDVLAENATVTMSVKDPEDKTVTTIDGKELNGVTPDREYTIRIEKYGTYRIEYKATDGTNKTRSIVSRVNVVDNARPKLEFEKTISNSYKIGDKLELVEATCSDNVTKEENIKLSIVVKYPSGVINAVSKSVQLDEEGVYEITYIAVDEAGNVGRVTMKTYVEGE